MLSITDGESCVGTVGREWAAPLGIPTIFLYDALTSGDISAGGGQLYSCRDAARVGQLIASGGMWYAQRSVFRLRRVVWKRSGMNNALGSQEGRRGQADAHDVASVREGLCPAELPRDQPGVRIPNLVSSSLSCSGFSLPWPHERELQAEHES